MSLLQDLTVAARVLRRSPGSTAIAALTLALGVGANTAIFSLVDAVLLRPLPYAEPQQLVDVRDDLRGLNLTNVGISQPELQDLAERSGVFQQISAAWPISGNVTGLDHPERIEAVAVSPNYFTMLGAQAQLGRVFGPQDRTAGFAEACVISDGFWRRLYGGDPGVLGKQLRLDMDLYTIVGVMPPRFRHPGKTIEGAVDLWVTSGFAGPPFPDKPIRTARFIPGAIGRLNPGMSAAQGQFQLDAFAAGLRRSFPADYPARSGWGVRLTPLQESLNGNLKNTLLLIFGAVACVLLICCVSIANLLVAKAVGRRREIAVRRALGAGNTTIIRQLLTESVLISLVGGAVGALLVIWVSPFLPRLVPITLPVADVGVDRTVLMFAAVASVLAGVVFGLAPLAPMLRSDIVNSLKEGSRGTTAGGHNRLRAALVGCEVAVSVMLLVGAGLLIHSFWNLNHVDPGFNPQNVLVTNVWLPAPNNPAQSPYSKPAGRTVLIREVLRRARMLPGVDSVAIAGGNSVPLVGWNSATFQAEGYAETASSLPVAETATVSPDFFRVLGAPLHRGRFLGEADDKPDHPSALVDESLVRRIWPGQDPVGRRIRVGASSVFYTIVGVVGDLKTDAFEAPGGPHVYLSIYERSGMTLSVLMRTQSAPERLGEALQHEIQAADADLPVFGVRTMNEIVARSLAQRRFQLQTVGAFALVALLLAAMGIYGVTAFWVGQRTSEIGIRIALGAPAPNVIRMVLRQGLILTLWGVVAGLAAALPMTRLLRSLLFGTTPTDPLTFAAVALAVSVAALLACYIPAVRATRVDPAVALHTE